MFFDYAEDGHTLVLFDARWAAEAPDRLRDGAVPFRGRWRGATGISRHGPRGGAGRPYAHTDYVEKPTRRSVNGQLSIPSAMPRRGRGLSPSWRASQGDAVATIRREVELQAGHQRIRAAGNGAGPLCRAAPSRWRAFRAPTRTSSIWWCGARYRLTDPGHRVGLAPEAENLPDRARARAHGAAYPAAPHAAGV